VLLKDIDGRLDFRCTIKIDQYDSIFNLTRSFDLRAPIFITKEGESYLFRAYFPERPNIPGLYEALLYFRAKLDNNRLELTGMVGNEKLIQILGPIIDIPSTSSLRVTAEKGKLVVRFRFHHNNLSEMSKIATSAIEELSASVRISTPTSVSSLLSWYNDRIEPVSVLSHRYPLDAFDSTDFLEYLKKGIVELSYSPVNPRRKFLLYLTEKPDTTKNITTISQEESTYEAPFENELINNIWEGFTTKRVSRIYTFFRLDETGVITTAFIPTSELNAYAKTLLESTKKLGVKAEIMIMNRFSTELWGYL